MASEGLYYTLLYNACDVHFLNRVYSVGSHMCLDFFAHKVATLASFTVEKKLKKQNDVINLLKTAKNGIIKILKEKKKKKSTFVIKQYLKKK